MTWGCTALALRRTALPQRGRFVRSTLDQMVKTQHPKALKPLI
jgi:hypothetical protein